MADISKVTSVTMIDGYGRVYKTVNPDDVLLFISYDGKSLKIMHNGDTAHSYTETYADEFELKGYKEGGHVDG